jgi:hypothetical protein
MKRLLILLFPLIAARASAIIDFNDNGISDTAERHLNHGQLLAPGTDVHAKLAGGWSLSEIATAGLSPDDATQGILRIEGARVPAVYDEPGDDGVRYLLTPESFTLTFATVAGKSYTIEASPDLSDWITVDRFNGEGGTVTQAIALTQPDGSLPERLFFRVRVEDMDSDSDHLNDSEEIELGTNPLSQYSDNDYLTDGYEVLESHTDPTNPDTNGDGIPDHEQLAQTDPDGQIASTYAPEFDFIGMTRSISYSYTEDEEATPPEHHGEVTSTGSWAGMLGGTQSFSSRLSVSGLPARLNGTLPFPSPDHLPERLSHFFESDSGVSEPDPHSESANHSESQIILRASRPPETDIIKNVMVLSYSHPVADYQHGTYTPPILQGIEPLSFKVPARKLHSDPKILGGDMTPVHRTIRIPEFVAASGSIYGWDDTGSEPWRAMGVGLSINGALEISGGLLDAEVYNLLEIAPAEGSQTSIAISDTKWWGYGVDFKINALAETLPTGATIVLRLKSNPGVVFASMHVRAYNYRTVPVTIFRVWDSRVPQSDFEYGFTDPQIIQALNDTYVPQSGIFFTRDTTSRKVDISGDALTHAVQPQMFYDDGTFPDSLAMLESLEQLTDRQNPSPAKITIHVVKKYGYGTRVGQATDDSLACIVGGDGARYATFPHEVGHILDLATTVGHTPHDLGPWPAAWAIDRKTGLMHPQSSEKTMYWLRQLDWEAAADKVRKQHLDMPR